MDDLKHFGVKGMRWGQKRSTSSSHVSKIKSKKAEADKQKEENMHPDAKKKRELKKKKISELSNADLKALNERLNLEKQYKDLSRNEKTKGKSFVEKQLSNAGNQVATTIVTSAALYAAKAALTKSFGANTADVLIPKKKK